jgi:hypothetical protein
MIGLRQSRCCNVPGTRRNPGGGSRRSCFIHRPRFAGLLRPSPCVVCTADHRRRERHAFSTETTRPRASRSRAALLVPREGGQWPSRSRCSWAMKAGVRCGAGRMRSLARASDRSVARSRSPRSWDGRAAMTPSAGHPPSRWLQFPRVRALMANAVLGSRSVVITAGASERCRCGGIAMGQTCGTVIPGLGGEPWRLLPRSRSV